MASTVDVFTGHVLCWHPECQWQTPDGVSGIEARFTDADGAPVCGEHYLPVVDKPKPRPKRQKRR